MENLKVTQFHFIGIQSQFPWYVRILLQLDKSRLLHHLRSILMCPSTKLTITHTVRKSSLYPSWSMWNKISHSIELPSVAAAVLIFPPSVAHLGFHFTVTFYQQLWELISGIYIWWFKGERRWIDRTTLAKINRCGEARRTKKVKFPAFAKVPCCIWEMAIKACWWFQGLFRIFQPTLGKLAQQKNKMRNLFVK